MFYIWRISIYGKGTTVVVIIWKLELQLPVQSVPITTKVVSSNPVHGEVYSIQHYVINLSVTWFSTISSSNKLTATI